MTSQANWKKITEIVFPSKETIDGAYLAPTPKTYPRVYLNTYTPLYPSGELSCYYHDALDANRLHKLSPELAKCVCHKLNPY